MPNSPPIAAPLLGWLVGALIPVEPDHLCALIALNAGTRQPWPAFCNGALWGLGHSLGMLVFCVVFLPLESLVNIEVWEYFGSYVAGALLVAIGLYFMYNESRYVETTHDGSSAPKQDACCSCVPGLTNGAPHVHGLHPHHGSCGTSDCDMPHEHVPYEPDEESLDSEKAPLLQAREKNALPENRKLSTRFWEDSKGALVGALQGLCCPSCIAGLAFVGQMGAQHPSGVDTAGFLTICFASIVFCSGFLSVATVVLGGYCGSYWSLSTRTLYRSACVFSCIAGFTWIGLNACGKLHVIDYTHSLEHRLQNMANAGTDGNPAMIMMHMH